MSAAEENPKSWLHLDALPVYHGGKTSSGNKPAKAKLSSNENPLGTSAKAKAAFRKAAKQLARYPQGEAVLLEALASREGIPRENLICGAGSGELLRILAHIFLSRGDEALMAADGFSLYPLLTLSEGAKPVQIPSKDWALDEDALLAALTPKTKLVFLANPNNPTGSFLDAEALAAFHARLPKRVLLVLDCAYGEFSGENPLPGQALAGRVQNLVMVRTFSKIYGLAGLRLGWAYGHESIIEAMRRVRLPYAVSGPAAAAALAALKDKAHFTKTQSHNAHWRHWVRENLVAAGLEVPSSAANFLLIRFPSPDAADKAWHDLAHHGLIVRQLGEDYGMTDCLRATIGTAAANRALVRILTRRNR